MAEKVFSINLLRVLKEQNENVSNLISTFHAIFFDILLYGFVTTNFGIKYFLLGGSTDPFLQTINHFYIFVEDHLCDTIKGSL